MLARQDKTQQAIAAARRATKAEPDNLEAWALLASIAEDSDPTDRRRSERQDRAS